MTGLDDVGKTIPIFNDYYPRSFKHNVEVAMVIEAPKGRIVVYDRPEKSPAGRSVAQEQQGEAIKAFMEFNNGGESNQEELTSEEANYEAWVADVHPDFSKRK